MENQEQKEGSDLFQLYDLKVEVLSGEKPMICDHQQAVYRVPPGERILLELPGGGGLGNPQNREIHKIEEDLEAGYISREGAKKDYGYGK